MESYKTRLIANYSSTHIETQHPQNPIPGVLTDNFSTQAQFSSNFTPYDTESTPTLLSNEKSQEIFEFVRDKLISENYGDGMFEGDRSHDHHLLSLKMMQSHIASYWDHFHTQFPICKS